MKVSWTKSALTDVHHKHHPKESQCSCNCDVIYHPTHVWLDLTNCTNKAYAVSMACQGSWLHMVLLSKAKSHLKEAQGRAGAGGPDPPKAPAQQVEGGT